MLKQLRMLLDLVRPLLHSLGITEPGDVRSMVVQPSLDTINHLIELQEDQAVALHRIAKALEALVNERPININVRQL